jgi:curved DNA-binding protein CbpA
MPLEPSNDNRMYHRLEVPPDASAQQIRGAYRRLAPGLHPDRRPDDPDAARRFQEITEAYEVLSDPERRARYDRTRGRSPISEGWTIRWGTARRTSVASPPCSGQGGTGRPPAIGCEPFPTGSAPLTAGPVRVVAPTDPPNRTTGVDLAGLVDAMFRVRRWG